MAELNLKQIIDRLNAEFTGETRKLVFWYDDKAEFAEDMETVELQNAKVYHLQPDNQFPGFPGKFRIQAVYNLFQVQFCHINFLYLIDSALWGISYRQLRLDPVVACDAANIIVNILHDAMIPHCVQ